METLLAIPSDLDLSDLTHDGDTVEINDRFRLRLMIEHDPDSSINDYDCYGKIEWCDRYHYHGTRPAGFNGAARKLWASSDAFWWQPWDTKEWAALTHEQQTRHLTLVRDLVEYGFKQVGLALEEEIQDYAWRGHWTRVDEVWIGGVDEPYPELVRDLLDLMLDASAHIVLREQGVSDGTSS